MVSLREWRTAGIIQCMRVWAVLQEEWLKDGNSIAYASKVPWLFQGGCGWQDMKDIYSQLSPESVDSRVIVCCISQSFFVPPCPPSHLPCLVQHVGSCIGRRLSAHRGKVTTKPGPEYEFHEESGKAAESLVLPAWNYSVIPTLHKPSNSQFLTQDSWDNMFERWILHCWSLFSGSF